MSESNSNHLNDIDDIIDNIGKLAHREDAVVDSMLQISSHLDEVRKRKPINDDESTSVMFEIKELGDDFVRKEIQWLRIKTEALKQLAPNNIQFLEHEMDNLESLSNKISSKMQDFCDFKIGMNETIGLEEMLAELKRRKNYLRSIIMLCDSCIYTLAAVARGGCSR